ncbi:TadE/TadG family type IV pilus assembly protein [Aestuariivita sp.]|jgi:Flp pilus assembly protein TadG|uniref:TadE/TadG family type IV pilus assembly protein n=1 Tax=Aestuariivita sp. TaxID=1872407 RepID=UPI00216F67A6|nr:TadE/TadG family type IV pilus assembly protein [Aestuariivita sp.]MCE8008939.1 pilus assembly protein [Aestuariivita sp.]|eukprot:TRINITY_DN25156_c0_g1_i1.p4 TRINITY_DN25156_c0_g1~~TRINITY_DN25156_c0_g1_i1.p4  ORF type:complete len:180 (+),score=2.84 TRINITY_DN25156_c0_g1_i1:1725-2264(+)
MMRFAHKAMRRFARKEDGNATIEFAVLFMPMFVTMLWAVELGMIHINYAMLERAVDATARDLRLATGTAPQHDDIRDVICERTGFVQDCANNLRIEMILIDPNNWSPPPATVDCADVSQPVEPVREFVNNAQSNELMFMRVCAKFDPFMPHIGMGGSIIKDGAGKYALVSSSAFVQEPR